MSGQFFPQAAQIFILVLGLSAQRFQAGHRFLGQRSGRLGRKLRPVDLPLQLLLLQRQRALLRRQAVLLLPLSLQRLLAPLQGFAGLLGLVQAVLVILPQGSQLFLQLPGGKLAALQLLFQLGDGIVIMINGILLDRCLHLSVGDRVLKLLDALALMLNIQVRVLCFVLDLLQLPLDLIQPPLGGGAVISSQQGLVLQLRQLPAQFGQLLQPQADLQRLLFPGQHHILLGLFALGLQGAYPVLQLLHDIPQAHQVILSLLQLALRFGLAVAEPGDSSGFLENFPPLGAFRAHDLRDLALLNDRIAIPSKACIHKHLVDIPQAHRVIIDAVFAFSTAVQPPGDDHLIAVDINAAVGIINKQAHPCKTGRLAADGPAENNILHLSAAQALHRLLAKHPLDGVADIAFAAAVWPHNDRDPVIEGQLCAVGEGLEPLHFHRFQLHGISSCPVRFLSFWGKLHTNSL